MKKDIEKEEQLKDKIYEIYFAIIKEPSCDRRQVYVGQLWENIIKWYGKYLSIDAHEMGKEIFDIIRRITKEDNNSNIPSDKDDFFRYLSKSLNTGENEYFRNFESGIIKIPKEETLKLKKIESILRMEESNLGRGLTDLEINKCLYTWFKYDKKEYQAYIDIYIKKNVASLQFTNNDNETYLLNSIAAQPYMPSTLNNPQDDYFSKLDNSKMKNAIELVLVNSQDRTRECYRSLFTAYCIDKSIIIEEIIPLLDREILKAYQKDGEKPIIYKIYQKYHPDVKKDSASVRASDMLKKLLENMNEALKEKL